MPGPADDENGGTDGEWQFSLDDLPDLEDESTADETDSDGNRADEIDSDGNRADEIDADDPDGSVAGGFAPSEVVEPGDIDPENAFFVLVGVLLAGLFVGGFLVATL